MDSVLEGELELSIEGLKDLPVTLSSDCMWPQRGPAVWETGRKLPEGIKGRRLSWTSRK